MLRYCIIYSLPYKSVRFSSPFGYCSPGGYLGLVVRTCGLFCWLAWVSTWISFNTPTSKVTVGAFRTMIQTVIHVGIVSLHNNISLCTHLHHTQHVFGRAADYSLHVLGTKQYLGFVLSILASHNLKSKHDDLHSSSQDLHAKWLLSTAYLTLLSQWDVLKGAVLYSLPYTPQSFT